MMGDVKRGMGCFYGLLLRWVWAESVYKLKKWALCKRRYLRIVVGTWGL